MMTVLGWLFYARAKDHVYLKRDKWIVLNLARGSKVKLVRNLAGGTDPSTIRKAKDKVMFQIETALRTEYSITAETMWY
jgi:hypothetical protein